MKSLELYRVVYPERVPIHLQYGISCLDQYLFIYVQTIKVDDMHEKMNKIGLCIENSILNDLRMSYLKCTR